MLLGIATFDDLAGRRGADSVIRTILPSITSLRWMLMLEVVLLDALMNLVGIDTIDDDDMSDPRDSELSREVWDMSSIKLGKTNNNGLEEVWKVGVDAEKY